MDTGGCNIVITAHNTEVLDCKIIVSTDVLVSELILDVKSADLLSGTDEKTPGSSQGSFEFISW